MFYVDHVHLGRFLCLGRVFEGFGARWFFWLLGCGGLEQSGLLLLLVFRLDYGDELK